MVPNGSRGLESLPVILAAHLSLESSLSASKIKSISRFTGSLPYKHFGTRKTFTFGLILISRR